SVAAAIALVGEDGTAKTGQVDAELVGAAGARMTTDVTVAAEPLDHLVIGAGIAALFLVVGDRHLDAVVRVPDDAALDVIAVAVEDAVDQGPVLLEDLAQLELHAQVAVRLLLLGDQDDAAGVAVEAMHDAAA